MASQKLYTSPHFILHNSRFVDFTHIFQHYFIGTGLSSYEVPIASEVTLKDMGKYIKQIL